MMKKTFLSIGAVAIALLMLSSATATPYVHTTTAVKKAKQTENLLTTIRNAIPEELDTNLKQLLNRLLNHHTIQNIIQSKETTALLPKLKKLVQRKLGSNTFNNLQNHNLKTVRSQLLTAATQLVKQGKVNEEIHSIVEQLGTLDIFLGELIMTIGKIIAFIGLMVMTINPPAGLAVVALGGLVFVIGVGVFYLP